MAQQQHQQQQHHDSAGSVASNRGDETDNEQQSVATSTTGGDEFDQHNLSLSLGGMGLTSVLSHDWHQQQQQRQAQRRSPSHHHQMEIPRRSDPIAIVRNNNNNNGLRSNTGDQDGESSDGDDDDDDGEVDVVELDALKIAKMQHQRLQRQHDVTSRSLPSRLLRAPHLRAIPTNDDSISYRNMLPPPALNEQSQQPPTSTAPTALPAVTARVIAAAAATPATGMASMSSPWQDRRTSYGSLRESHERGRFLDGPSSYRDRRTGDIRFTQHRVRFQQETSDVAAEGDDKETSPAMSIGERIMKSRQRQVQSSADATPHEQKSSLAAMLEASGDTKMAAAPMAAAPPSDLSFVDDSDWRTSVSFSEQHSERRSRSNMVSTSLTGLEVLQSNFRLSSDTTGSNRSREQLQVPDAEPPNEIPAMLSRSLSDPSPRLAVMAAAVARGGVASTTTSPSAATAAAAVGVTLLPPQYPYRLHEPAQDLAGNRNDPDDDEPTDHNPDTQAAFVMDLE